MHLGFETEDVLEETQEGEDYSRGRASRYVGQAPADLPKLAAGTQSAGGAPPVTFMTVVAVVVSGIVVVGGGFWLFSKLKKKF